MSDTILFMSAYKAIKLQKHIRLFHSNIEIEALLEKHNIECYAHQNHLMTSQGIITLDVEYDDVFQQISYKYKSGRKNTTLDSQKYSELVSSYVKLLHAQRILLDPRYFKVDSFYILSSFIVYIDDQTYQINPKVFTLNETYIIAFEVINFSTKEPLGREDISAKASNFNIRKIRGYRHFHEEFSMLSNLTIPELIYAKVNNFFTSFINKRFTVDNYAYVHSTLVISEEVSDITQCFCGLIGVNELSTSPRNISTTNDYEYYVQDGSSIVTGFEPENIETALYHALTLESIKLYVYLFQIENTDITKDYNAVLKNDLYLENLFFAPKVPIETSNFLTCVYKTASFQLRKEASKLKLTYMAMENELRKNRNATLLNILLYVISLLGAISALDILEEKLSLPFQYTFYIVLFLFIVLGGVWICSEFKRNKRS